MKTVEFDGRKFWEIPFQNSAIRPHKQDRIEILTWDSTGEVQCKSRTAKPATVNTVKTMFERSGIA